MDFNSIIALTSATGAISMATINMATTATNTKKIAKLERQLEEIKKEAN